MNRKVFLIACGMSAVMLFTGCTRRSVENVVNEVNKSIDTSMDDDPHVQMVKNGTGFDYPDSTYGEAFEAFFAEPKWKYFQAKDPENDTEGLEGEEIQQESGTESGEELVDIVEFTGYCFYQSVEVETCMQFQLDMNSGMFQAVYVGFNDVPQSTYMANTLIDKAFDAYLEEHGMSDRITEE